MSPAGVPPAPFAPLSRLLAPELVLAALLDGCFLGAAVVVAGLLALLVLVAALRLGLLLALLFLLLLHLLRRRLARTGEGEQGSAQAGEKGS